MGPMLIMNVSIPCRCGSVIKTIENSLTTKKKKTTISILPGFNVYRRPFDPSAACQGMSPSLWRMCRAPPAPSRAVEPPLPPLPPPPFPVPLSVLPELTLRSGVADASDAVLLIRFGARAFFPGVSEPPLFVFPTAGFKPGLSVGTISLASSLTRTAPSPPPRLNRSTTPNNPYRSTNIARLGCTSQTVLRTRSKLRRTTALLLCPSRSMMRLKNAEDFVMLMVTGADRRVIFKNGSSKFSNEFAFAVTKQRSNASTDAGFVSSSSTLAVSS